MDTIIKPIRNAKDHQVALKLLEELLEHDPDPDSNQGRQIKILATLIEKYETDNFPFKPPSALEAIKFRMEQLDMKPVDLVPYLGSFSRVSEILSGKRQLTVAMIRALESGLGIPAKALLRQDVDQHFDVKSLGRSLLKIMHKRDYFQDFAKESNLENMAKGFFEECSSQQGVPALWRQANYRSAPRTNRCALVAWATKVSRLAAQKPSQKGYVKGCITLERMREIARLSSQPDGPLQARARLQALGIGVIIEPHLPQTYLDGVVLPSGRGSPIIGLTLRYNRLDYFWFTLMHELAHVSLHFDDDQAAFFDSLEPIKGLNIEQIESEADALASNALVPDSKWLASPVRILPTVTTAQHLATELGVDIAIVVGKIRFTTGQWGYMKALMKDKRVHHFFAQEMQNAR